MALNAGSKQQQQLDHIRLICRILVKRLPSANFNSKSASRLQAKVLLTRFSSIALLKAKTPRIMSVRLTSLTYAKTYRMMIEGIVPGAQVDGGYTPWTMCCRDSIVRAMFVELRV